METFWRLDWHTVCTLNIYLCDVLSPWSTQRMLFYVQMCICVTYLVHTWHGTVLSLWSTWPMYFKCLSVWHTWYINDMETFCRLDQHTVCTLNVYLCNTCMQTLSHIVHMWNLRLLKKYIYIQYMYMCRGIWRMTRLDVNNNNFRHLTGVYI